MLSSRLRAAPLMLGEPYPAEVVQCGLRQKWWRLYALGAMGAGGGTKLYQERGMLE